MLKIYVCKNCGYHDGILSQFDTELGVKTIETFCSPDCEYEYADNQEQK